MFSPMGHGWSWKMPDSSFDMVDLLEVYRARTVRRSLLSEIARLQRDDDFLPGSDPVRRQEIAAYYQAMLSFCSELQHTLGDGD